MKRFVALIVLLVAGVAVLGLYRGWVHVGSENGVGQSNVTVSVDKDKIRADTNTAADEVKDAGHRVTGKAAATTQKN